MITPIFRLYQDDYYVFVTLVVPNMRLSEAEIFYDQREFIFYSKPYYLRLELPGLVRSSEDKEETVPQSDQKEIKFDCDSNELSIPVPKVTVGEHFPNLDMITQLLTGPKTKASRRLVEVIDSGIESVYDIEDGDDFDWNIEQKAPTDSNGGGSAALLGRECYGFGNCKSGVIERLGTEQSDICDIAEPGTKTITERRAERIRQEKSDFSEDHYLADLFETTENIDHLIDSVAPWDTWVNGQILTDHERQRMIDHIPKRILRKFDPQTKRSLMLAIIDILYAYVYDLRTNDYEHSVESAWTIRKVSPTLSCLESWIPIGTNNLTREILASCVRRSLTYPLYRNWRLSNKILEDVIKILSKGRDAVLKCFLDIHSLFNEKGDNYYLLNDLYITDYCLWIQQINSGRFESLAEYLKEVKLRTDDVELDLELLERAAQLALEGQETEKKSKDLSKAMENCLKIEEEGEDFDSDDEPLTT